MKRGDIIKYIEMTMEEGFPIQRGMYFNIPNRVWNNSNECKNECPIRR